MVWNGSNAGMYIVVVVFPVDMAVASEIVEYAKDVVLGVTEAGVVGSVGFYLLHDGADDLLIDCSLYVVERTHIAYERHDVGVEPAGYLGKEIGINALCGLVVLKPRRFLGIMHLAALCLFDIGSREVSVGKLLLQSDCVAQLGVVAFDVVEFLLQLYVIGILLLKLAEQTGQACLRGWCFVDVLILFIYMPSHLIVTIVDLYFRLSF